MRVLFVASTLSYGGAERQLVLLARGLADAGHSVAIALFYPGGPLETDLAATAVALHDISKRGKWDIFGAVARLRSVARRFNPDVVHSYLVAPNVIAGLAQLWPGSRPLVWGVRTSKMDESQYTRVDRVAFQLERLLVKVPTHIIANSRAGAEFALQMGARSERVSVVPNGIDTQRFRRNSEGRMRIRSELRVEPECRLVGLVGRLDPMKGHETLLEATAAMSAEARGRFRFAFVGDGPASYVVHLHQQAARLGVGAQIVWSNARKDVADLYSALDVLVLPSSFGEGFPNVVGEAMSCETPCLVTDVGDSASVVGDCGWVVPPRDPKAVASVLELLARASVADLADKGRASRARVESMFSVRALVETTEAVLLKASRRDFS